MNGEGTPDVTPAEENARLRDALDHARGETLRLRELLDAEQHARLQRRRRLRRRGLMILGLASLVLLVAFLARGPLLRGFAGLFRVDDPTQCDAIVLLLGGPDHRPGLAAALYRQGLAPRIIFGQSEVLEPLLIDQTELTQRILIREGVPREAIVVLPDVVTSTWDEARAVKAYAVAQGYRSLTLVTTAFHTARARWVFRKILAPDGVDVHAAAANHPRFTETDWYYQEDGLIAYVEEFLKTLLYRIKYR